MTDRTPNRTFMQTSGTALCAPVPALLDILDHHKAARDIILRYVHCFEMQLAHSALASGRYSVKERLARWLLMCQDRLGGDNLALTHEFLALMLGVRRPGVTSELQVLEGMHAIKVTRGNVQVINRGRLEEIAGGCYGLPEREYERLIGLPIATAS
jgi:CRP-like cAMP-binding protein